MGLSIAEAGGGGAVAVGGGGAGECGGRGVQRDGAVLLHRRGRDVANVDDRGRQPGGRARGARGWTGKCGDRGGVERGAAAVLRGGAVRWVLRVSGWDYVEAAAALAGERVEGDGLAGDSG